MGQTPRNQGPKEILFKSCFCQLLGHSDTEVTTGEILQQEKVAVKESIQSGSPCQEEQESKAVLQRD